jgi:hypothetical protein
VREVEAGQFQHVSEQALAQASDDAETEARRDHAVEKRAAEL